MRLKKTSYPIVALYSSLIVAVVSLAFNNKDGLSFAGILLATSGTAFQASSSATYNKSTSTKGNKRKTKTKPNSSSDESIDTEIEVGIST